MMTCSPLFLALVLAGPPAVTGAETPPCSRAGTLHASFHSTGTSLCKGSRTDMPKALLGRSDSATSDTARPDGFRRWRPGPGCFIVPAAMLTVFGIGYLLVDRRFVTRFRCSNCGSEMKVRHAVPGDRARCDMCGYENTVSSDEIEPDGADAATEEQGQGQAGDLELLGRPEVVICPKCRCVSTQRETSCPACGTRIRKVCGPCGILYDAGRASCPRCGRAG